MHAFPAARERQPERVAMVGSPRTLPPRYRSPQPIAQGGMGDIYRATDDLLGRDVVVKVLAGRFARDRALLTRFTREARAAARLSGDPYTVTVYDVGEWEGRPYIVMEYLPGGTVADRIETGPVDPPQALRWLEQAAAALDAAHAHGVVHRDVKPQNLLLAADGTVRVADFGIASAAGLTSVTTTGTILGTLGYLAPEQARGETTTAASDRYALAVVAYELLAGRRPFERDSAAAEAAAAASEAVPPISRRRRSLPPTLDPLFARALAGDPRRRYPTGAEFVGDLRRAFHDAAGATSVEVAPARRRRRRAAWLLPALLAALAVGAGGIAAGLLLAGGRGGGHGVAAAVHTVTTPAGTVTVTAEQQAPSTASAPPPAGTSGAALDDQAWALMQQGNYRQALPLLQQAVALLRGTGSLAEAYALYNLAATEFALGQCGGVGPLLDRSEQIQGRRTEIDALRRQVRKTCR